MNILFKKIELYRTESNVLSYSFIVSKKSLVNLTTISLPDVNIKTPKCPSLTRFKCPNSPFLHTPFPFDSPYLHILTLCLSTPRCTFSSPAIYPRSSLCVQCFAFLLPSSTDYERNVIGNQADINKHRRPSGLSLEHGTGAVLR